MSPKKAALLKPVGQPKRVENRPSWRERGYGSAAWARMRMEVYARDLGMCQSCGRVVGKPKEAHIDHIKPKSQGGLDLMENLQLLCVSCHSRKTAKEYHAGCNFEMVGKNGGRGAKKRQF